MSNVLALKNVFIHSFHCFQTTPSPPLAGEEPRAGEESDPIPPPTTVVGEERGDEEKSDTPPPTAAAGEEREEGEKADTTPPPTAAAGEEDTTPPPTTAAGEERGEGEMTEAKLVVDWVQVKHNNGCVVYSKKVSVCFNYRFQRRQLLLKP